MKNYETVNFPLSTFSFPLALLLLCIVHPSAAQDASVTDWQVELSGSASTSRQTPFWIVGNRYGIVPLEAGNGYTRAGVSHSLQTGPLRLRAAIDMVAVAPRYRSVYVHQAYAEIAYRRLLLTVGSRENYTSMWDERLSSGDMVASANARPIPEINISVPQFTVLPGAGGWLQFCGHFAVGRSFDGDYLNYFRNEQQDYVRDILWHHKSLHVRLSDTQGESPFSIMLGVRHHAQWGGVSSDPKVGKQPVSFKDFIRVVAGSSGGDNATPSDQVNVLGNHFGSYDLKLGYLNPHAGMYLYKQHFFDDASGRELFNFPDGLYGFQVNLFHFPEINKIVVEYLNTRDQSGPIHYINFDHSKYPGYGGGNDDYYNNGDYLSGMSYFNRSIGSPLLTSPEYNTDGRLGFKNSRVRAFHLGFEGYLSKRVAYRALATSTENWGTMFRPFLEKKISISGALQLSYCHPRFNDWRFSGEIAADAGDMYGRHAGIAFTIAKTGAIFGVNRK